MLRAIDIQTGKVAWELPQFGDGGLVGRRARTASDVVFFGDDSGAFAAADAQTGKRAVELPDQPGVEGVADDLRVRQPAASWPWRRGRTSWRSGCRRRRTLAGVYLRWCMCIGPFAVYSYPRGGVP